MGRAKSTMPNAVDLELELAVSRRELAQMRLERDEALNALDRERQAATIAKDHAHIASQEAADIADSLQSQLRTLRDTMAAVEAAHKREAIHLTDSIRECEHSQSNRDTYSQSQSKAKNLALLYEKHETGKSKEALENAKDELFKTKGALCKSTNEVRERPPDLSAGEHVPALRNSSPLGGTRAHRAGEVRTLGQTGALYTDSKGETPGSPALAREVRSRL